MLSNKLKPDAIKLETDLIQTAKCDAETWKVEQEEQHKLKGAVKFQYEKKLFLLSWKKSRDIETK